MVFLAHTFLKMMVVIGWLNAHQYFEMLRRYFIPALRRQRGFDINIVVFLQDGAPPHCFDHTLQYFLGDRLISRRTVNPWLPYSSDLSLPDYFLWGYLKERVYEGNADTIDRLKENIERNQKNSELLGESWTISSSEWQMSSSSEAPESNRSSIITVTKHSSIWNCFWTVKLQNIFCLLCKKSCKNSYICRNCNNFILCPTL